MCVCVGGGGGGDRFKATEKSNIANFACYNYYAINKSHYQALMVYNRYPPIL